MTAVDGERNKEWRCNGRNKMFTVSTSTVFKESCLPLRVVGVRVLESMQQQKGISALQLAREMEITHKSALFVQRRIRHGLSHQQNDDPKLTGTVEAGETFVGGRRSRHEARTQATSHKISGVRRRAA